MNTFEFSNPVARLLDVFISQRCVACIVWEYTRFKEIAFDFCIACAFVNVKLILNNKYKVDFAKQNKQTRRIMTVAPFIEHVLNFIVEKMFDKANCQTEDSVFHFSVRPSIIKREYYNVLFNFNMPLKFNIAELDNLNNLCSCLCDERWGVFYKFNVIKFNIFT